MEWKPETRGLNELLNLLQDAIHPSNRDRQLVQTVKMKNYIFSYIYIYILCIFILNNINIETCFI
jgi:hypothetical protein